MRVGGAARNVDWYRVVVTVLALLVVVVTIGVFVGTCALRGPAR